MRISVTDVDSYQYYRNSNLSTEEFVRRLRRESPPTDALRLGTALHALLEDLTLGEPPTFVYNGPHWYYEKEGFTFDFSQVEVTLEEPNLVEAKFEKVYDLGVLGEVTLVGKVDAIRGNQIIEYKTTKQVDIDRYRDLFQWKAYLDMLPDMQSCKWHIFRHRTKGSHCVIQRHHTLTLYRYDELADDVRGLLYEYVEFIRDLGFK